MKRFSAQYIITGTGEVLKRGVVSCDDSGKIIDVSDTGGVLKETPATPFYNGILVPGFVNCHSHIELSDMKGLPGRGKGLGEFISEVREKRNPVREEALKAIKQADRDLYRSGTSALADICNTSLSFDIKDKSPLKYINLLEVFGIDPAKASKRIEDLIALKEEADSYSTPSYIVPHSAYSLSKTLFKELSLLIKENDITSIHFLESPQERQLLEKLEGELMESYMRMGIGREDLSDRLPDHLYALNNYLPLEGNLILVHNTCADSDIIGKIQERPDVYWCLCPSSNIYIEDRLPPVGELIRNSATIVLGTDSLASNNSLNLLEELKILQKHFSSPGLPELITWATRNGARALRLDDLGTIEEGKTPGLVLIEECDLENLRLTDNSRSRRLI
jgi:cytosine/adenosine deaminase-related metal-dependent hydrolase